MVKICSRLIVINKLYKTYLNNPTVSRSKLVGLSQAIYNSIFCNVGLVLVNTIYIFKSYTKSSQIAKFENYKNC